MAQEDKKILLQDLCARLPYRTMVKCNTDYHHEFNEELSVMHIINFYQFEIKPYLRPLSSMTEEEEKEFEKIFELELKAIESPVGHTIESAASSAFEIDFYNKYHFDYRGLIEKGLALEAPDNMYKHFGDMDVVVTSIEYKHKL